MPRSLRVSSVASVAPLALALALVAPPARAADGAAPRAEAATSPDGAVALLAGAVTIFVGFAVGGTLIATGTGDASKTTAGWLALESGVALAPFTAHAPAGEWGRGVLFASVPLATTLCSVPVFAADPGAVEHGSLEEQRVLWGLLVGGLLASSAGVVDAAMVFGRVRVLPALGPRQAGLVLVIGEVL